LNGCAVLAAGERGGAAREIEAAFFLVGAVTGEAFAGEEGFHLFAEEEVGGGWFGRVVSAAGGESKRYEGGQGKCRAA